MILSTCNYCGQEATYDSPENLCEEHWFKKFWLANYSKIQLMQLAHEPGHDAQEAKMAKELLENSET